MQPLCTAGTDDGEFSMALGQTLAAFLPWYRWLIQTKPGPGTDICSFTALGQTLTASLPCFRPEAPIAAQLRAAACDVTGGLASLTELQILGAQVTQICSMDI